MIVSKRIRVTEVPFNLRHFESVDSLPGQVVVIKNIDSSQTCYLGGQDVTVNNGWPLWADENVSLEMPHNQDIYVVAGSATDIAVMWIDVK